MTDCASMPEILLALDRPLDLVLTLRLLYRGRGDPTMRLARHQVERAGRSPGGPYSIRIWRSGDALRAEAWGPGAA